MASSSTGAGAAGTGQRRKDKEGNPFSFKSFVETKAPASTGGNDVTPFPEVEPGARANATGGAAAPGLTATLDGAAASGRAGKKKPARDENPFSFFNYTEHGPDPAVVKPKPVGARRHNSDDDIFLSDDETPVVPPAPSTAARPLRTGGAALAGPAVVPVAAPAALGVKSAAKAKPRADAGALPFPMVPAAAYTENGGPPLPPMQAPTSLGRPGNDLPGAPGALEKSSRKASRKVDQPPPPAGAFVAGDLSSDFDDASDFTEDEDAAPAPSTDARKNTSRPGLARSSSGSSSSSSSSSDNDDGGASDKQPGSSNYGADRNGRGAARGAGGSVAAAQGSQSRERRTAEKIGHAAVGAGDRAESERSSTLRTELERERALRIALEGKLHEAERTFRDLRRKDVEETKALEDAMRTVEQALATANQRTKTAEAQVGKLQAEISLLYPQLQEARRQAQVAQMQAQAAAAAASAAGQGAFPASGPPIGADPDVYAQVQSAIHGLDKASKDAREGIKLLLGGAAHLESLSLVLQNLGRLTEPK